MTREIKDNTGDDTSYTEKTYLTSEVAKMLGIAATTVRKYSQNLESHGYLFTKGKGAGNRQARLFIKKDVTVLRYLKEIREETNITVDRATGIVIERFGKGATQSTLSKQAPKKIETERYVEQHKELKKMINKQSELLLKQNELILNLIERLDHQEEYINKKIDVRLNESNKQSKQIEAFPRNKKDLLARIFNK